MGFWLTGNLYCLVAVFYKKETAKKGKKSKSGLTRKVNLAGLSRDCVVTYEATRENRDSQGCSCSSLFGR